MRYVRHQLFFQELATRLRSERQEDHGVNKTSVFHFLQLQNWALIPNKITWCLQRRGLANHWHPSPTSGSKVLYGGKPQGSGRDIHSSHHIQFVRIEGGRWPRQFSMDITAIEITTGLSITREFLVLIWPGIFYCSDYSIVQ